MSDLKSRLNKSKNGNNKPKFKKLYISGGGKEFIFRLLSTEAVDQDALPFQNVFLHGGFYHPNYDQKSHSKFHCIGRKNNCPLCTKAWNDFQAEQAGNVAKENKVSWKMRAQKYSIYWAINRASGELVLVHVPDHAFSKDQATLQDKLFEKLVSAADQGLDPFDLDAGNDITITSTVVDGKSKYTIRVLDEVNAVDDKVKATMKRVTPLADVYKRMSFDDLTCVVEGRKIEYKNSQASNNEKVTKEVSKEIESDDSASSMTADESALLEDNIDTDLFFDEEASSSDDGNVIDDLSALLDDD